MDRDLGAGRFARLDPVDCSARRAQLVLVVLGIGTASALAYALGLPPPRLWNGDSAGYVNWSPFRTPGYPAFLSAVALVSPSFGALRLVQSACFVLATVFFCDGVAQLAPRRWLAIGLGCGVLLIPAFWKRAGEIRPEILFVCLIELFFGASALALAARRARWGAMAGAALGLAILVRPVGYALVPGLLAVATAIWRRQGARPAGALVAPLLGLLASTSLANGVLRGYYGTQAFGGVLFLGKVAPLIPGDGFGDPVSARMGAALSDLHPRVEGAGNSDLFWISQQTYTPLLWNRLEPLLAASGGNDPVAMNQIASAVSRAALTRDPRLYARLVAVHLESMWTWPWITTRDRIAPIQELMESAPLRDALDDPTRFHDFVDVLVPEWLYCVKLAVLACAFGLCCLLPFLALATGLVDPLLVLTAAAALSLQTYNLAVAAIDVAISRFALPAVPMLGLTAALGIPAILPILRRIGARRR